MMILNVDDAEAVLEVLVEQVLHQKRIKLILACSMYMALDDTTANAVRATSGRHEQTED
jgi:hypothetical protein